MLNRIGLSLGASLFVAATAVCAQTASFSVAAHPDNLWAESFGLNGHIKADLNGDGLEDFISVNSPSFPSGCTGSFAITLSKHDGTYDSPVCYTLPGGYAFAFAAADFLGSGQMHLIVASDNGQLYLYRNLGGGALQLENNVSTLASAVGIEAVDVDGDKIPDIVYDAAGASGSISETLYVLLGNGDGTFRTGPSTSFRFSDPGALFIGDFDGDGIVDIGVQGTTGRAIVLFGDRGGNFTPGPVIGSSAIAYGPADVNNDGIMDLVGTPLGSTSSITYQTTLYHYLDLQLGNSGRAFTHRVVPLTGCASDYNPPAVADLNGDGTNDLLVIEAADCTGLAPYTLYTLPGLGKGLFGPEQKIYSSTGYMYEPHILRADSDTKPDGFVYTSDVYGNNGQNVLLFNTTSGNFPKCNPPSNQSFGINVCSPASTTSSSSPVQFSIGASNQEPARDLQIWVDGNQVADRFKQSFSYYDFADVSVPLSAGSHTVKIDSKSWDGTLESMTFPLTVK